VTDAQEEYKQQNLKLQGPSLYTIKQKINFETHQKRNADNVLEDITNIHIEYKTEQIRWNG
jgi:hypothetical protein